MKVNLIKEAVYDLNEEKSTKIPFDTFLKLVNAENFGTNSDAVELPKVRIFDSIEEFRNKGRVETLDEHSDVYVLSSGKFCAFIKNKDLNKADNTEKAKEVKNESTDTKKDSATKA